MHGEGKWVHPSLSLSLSLSWLNQHIQPIICHPYISRNKDHALPKPTSSSSSKSTGKSLMKSQEWLQPSVFHGRSGCDGNLIWRVKLNLSGPYLQKRRGDSGKPEATVTTPLQLRLYLLTQ